MKDRHLVGAGAAACAVCCAAPILTVFGVAGGLATVATFVFAGVAFGVVVATGALLAVWRQRRSRRDDCLPPAGPADVQLSQTRLALREPQS